MSLSLEVRVRNGPLELDVRLEVPPGLFALTGPNGAGKTTLLRAALGLLRPLSGRIAMGGRVLFGNGVDLPPEDRRLGYVPQSLALFPHLSALDNVRFGVRDRGAALAALESLDAGHLAQRRPDELSGGEKQRVALARALARRPEALLLDEPLASLDQTARRQVRDLLRARVASLPVPVLLVTHDPVDAFELGARVAVLEKGRIVQVGTPAELQAKPATPFVADFLAHARP